MNQVFSLWVFLSIAFILTILAVAVQETFKPTIISVGGQDCGVFAELCVKRSILMALCLAVAAEQSGCREPQYLACPLPGTGRLG